MRMLMIIIFMLGIAALGGCEKTIREAGDRHGEDLQLAIGDLQSQECVRGPDLKSA